MDAVDDLRFQHFMRDETLRLWDVIKWLSDHNYVSNVMQQEYDDLVSEIEDLEDRNADLAERIDELESEASSLEDEIFKLEEQVEILQAKVDELS